MVELLRRILIAWRTQGGPTTPREIRRKNKRLRGRINPDGKFFGGVEPSKKQKEQRFLAGKSEHV